LLCYWPCDRSWLQFNAGSAGGAGYLAGQAFLNTNAAAATGMLTFMLMVRQQQQARDAVACHAVLHTVALLMLCWATATI
jgi:ammonia channel protein AmtB